MGALRPEKLQGLSKGGKVGLYANINAKRKRIAAGSGEKMRKPGEPGAPTAKAFVNAAKTANYSSGGGVKSKAAYIDGNEFVIAAQKYGLDDQNISVLNKIVKRVNDGESVDQAARNVAKGT